MFPRESAAVNAGLVTDQGHIVKPSQMARSIHVAETTVNRYPCET